MLEKAFKKKMMFRAMSCSMIFIASAVFWTRYAYGNQYEAFIHIDNEEDLYELKASNVIEDYTFEILVELLQRGVNLDTASRKTIYALPNLTLVEVDAILSYRDAAGRIRDPAELVSQGILEADKLSAIAPFLVVRVGEDEAISVKGRVRLQTRYSSKDTGAPASALQVRAHGLGNIRVGLVILNSRNTIGKVHYDSARNSLSAKKKRHQTYIPKLFVHWEGKKMSALAGTYRIGFGQRLTFDTTDQVDPDGFYGDQDVFRGAELTRDCKLSAGELDSTPCPTSEGYTYVSPDYKTRNGLLGLAATLREIKIGTGMLEAHVFASYQAHSIYQYELYNKAICDDPRGEDATCSAPEVFQTAENYLDRSPKFSFQTLPNVYAEKLVGGHLGYALGRRTHFGVTGYVAAVDWLVEGMDLDFQEWSRLPFGGSFGAVGVEFGKGIGRTDFLGEITRSYDGMPTGGGVGGLIRTVTGWKKHEIESSLRYYDKNFKNPHARPIAAADEFEGARARDEVGAKVKYVGEIDKRFRIRSTVDFWTSPSQGTKEVSASVRGKWNINDLLSFDLWTKYQDRDLARNGRGECYAGTESDVGPNGPLHCAGQLLQGTSQFRVFPTKKIWFDVQYQHKLLDDSKYDSKYRQDISFVARATFRPNNKLLLRARTRYKFEDISDDTYLEKSLWSYLDVSYQFRRKDKLKLRYDLVQHLDKRSGTLIRKPNPEQWIRLEYEAFF